MLPGMDAALLTLPLETLRSMLTEAIEALHKLAIGDRVVSVQLDKNNGRRTEFSEVNIAQLRAHVADLQSAIMAKETGRTTTRKPIYLSF